MDITREQAVGVFERLGFAEAAKWGPKKLLQRLEGLYETVEDDQHIGESYWDNILDELIDCGNTGEKIFIKSKDLQKERLKLEAAENKIEQIKEKLADPKRYKNYVKRPPYLVSPIRTREFMAGVIFRKYGIDQGITDEILNELDQAYGRNRRQSIEALKAAWHSLHGWIYGQSGLTWERREKVKDEE